MGLFDFLKKSKVKTEYRNIGIEEIELNTNDPQSIIDPVWWSVSIYDGEEKYNQDLEKFSLPQRYIFAIQWYVAEVNNGGHDQFFFNSTGIVWKDALQGLKEIGHKKAEDILVKAIALHGGNPPLDRDSRQDLLDKCEVDFEELDSSFYQIDNLDKFIMDYIHKNAQQFLFDGNVQIPT